MSTCLISPFLSRAFPLSHGEGCLAYRVTGLLGEHTRVVRPPLQPAAVEDVAAALFSRLANAGLVLPPPDRLVDGRGAFARVDRVAADPAGVAVHVFTPSH